MYPKHYSGFSIPWKKSLLGIKVDVPTDLEPRKLSFSARTQNHLGITMVFENDRKSLIQHCERSELRLQKFIKNAKNGRFGELFENVKITVLPDRSILIEQKLVENAKI